MYNTGLSAGYAGLMPDLSGRWYGFGMKMPYLRQGTLMHKPAERDALTITIKQIAYAITN